MKWLLVLALAGLTGEPPRVQFVHAPSIVWDTADITYEVRVPRNDQNRLLLVAAFDGDPDPVQRSDRDLDGNSPALFTFKWRLPAGRIQLSAVLYDAGGLVARDVWMVTVRSRFVPDEEQEP